MIDYIELKVNLTPCSEVACDLLSAFLADEGYESFVPDEHGVTAYVNSSIFDKDALKRISDSFPMDVTLEFSHNMVKGRDWNEEWEKNYFKPIVVGDRCVIHSTFHTDVPHAEYDIVIDPKMAFGTGHHATTSMMIEYLLELNLTGKSVIDMGTGTGILAILCAMRGAVGIDAVEIDEGACVNARENMNLNAAGQVNVLLGDADILKTLKPADLFIANINRNIILADFDAYVSCMKPDADMLLSGFYEQDVPLLQSRAQQYGLQVAQKKTRDNWCALRLAKC